jgi:hypothetical protein
MTHNKGSTPWLFLTFTLPTKRSSERVEVWRRLQRLGSVPLGNAGYLLPNNPANQERFEWLAAAIRKYSGEASVVLVQSIDNLSTPQLIGRFADARAREYQELIQQLQGRSSSRRRTLGHVNRLRARFLEISQIDFFKSPLQKRVKELLSRADEAPAPAETTLRVDPRKFVGRGWITRPRPGIDRSASAWLIQRFIDKKARFIFGTEDRVPYNAVCYDMFHGGFGHRGEDCTFETLQTEFRIRDQKVRIIGEIIHDADLLDQKFGRYEGFGIDAVLNGLAKQGVPDNELLKRGMHMIEALYHSI